MVYNMLISHLNDGPVWLSEEVPVSLFQPVQVEGVDRHVGAGLSLRQGRTLSWGVTGGCRARQGVFHCPDIVVDCHLIKHKGDNDIL